MKIYLVGGAVRDKLLGLPVKERDYVVTGASVQEMLNADYQQVGKEFPVFLHPETREEYALARMERKVAPGYKGFAFDSSPEVTLEEDLQRRDLTINAMALDLETEELIDPYGGQSDLEKRILRHVADAFAEDPVRILRVGRFLARYAGLGFVIAPETVNLMKDMVKAGEVDALVAERVWKELERALGEKNPEKLFETLAACGALAILFPHLQPTGPGMLALRQAQTLTPSVPVRFAVLFHALPEDAPDKAAGKTQLSALCNRYRVPNACQELAKLVHLHADTALRGRELSADDILQLFSQLDIYRREARFQEFVLACQAIAMSRSLSFDTEYLKAAAQVTKGYDVQLLIQKGLDGAELAAALKEQRREAIRTWMAQSK